MFACSLSLAQAILLEPGWNVPMVSKAEVLAPEGTAPGAAPVSLDDAYARFVPYVAKLGFRLLGRSDEVDDLIQDVFVVATERFGTLRDPGALRGWLAAITVRTAVRRLRRRRLKNLIFPHAYLALDDIASHLNAGASPEQAHLLSEVFRSLERIPVKDRIAWSLRVLEEEPLERVAELCGCSLATAKRRIAAAQTLIDQTVGS
jgi:RNA polymerase sigma-70 factor, ECF subfamily